MREPPAVLGWLPTPISRSGERQATATPGRGVQLLYGLAVACTIVAGLVLTSQFVVSAIGSVGLAWPITHPEGATIAAILRVRDGQPLY